MASIEDVLGRWLKKNQIRKRTDRNAIFQKWAEIVGEELATKTRPVDVRAGELIVEVESAPLLNELSTYYREEILETLRQTKEFSKILNIRFRAGSF